MLAFTSSAMIATALLSGIAPAARAARGDPMDALKEQIRGAGRVVGRWTGALMVSQVALSLVLVVAAGLFVKTFAQLANVPLGFDRDCTMVVTLTAPTVPATERNLFYHRLIRTAAAVPGVLSAGGSLNPPLIGTLNGDLAISRAGEPPARDAVLVSQGMDITPGWLRAYGLPLRAGRDFDDRDTVKSPPVMIVNEALVRRLFPGENLIGARVLLTYRSAQFGDIPIGVRTVVGIVGDAVYRSMLSAAAPTIYSALAQRSDPMLWTSSTSPCARRQGRRRCSRGT